MESMHRNEAVIVEKDGRKYAFLPLCTFNDIPTNDRDKQILEQFGLKDLICSKSLYEIVDEKKLMMAKIKYEI
jgi:hypothetical protein